MTTAALDGVDETHEDVPCRPRLCHCPNQAVAWVEIPCGCRTTACLPHIEAFRVWASRHRLVTCLSCGDTHQPRIVRTWPVTR